MLSAARKAYLRIRSKIMRIERNIEVPKDRLGEQEYWKISVTDSDKVEQASRVRITNKPKGQTESWKQITLTESETVELIDALQNQLIDWRARG